jgi:hypothetical protein
MVSSIYPRYAKYTDAFTNKFSLDYDGLEGHYLKYSDSVGVYPDVSFLLYSLAAHPGVSTITEFGSGMSSMILSEAAQRFQKSFSSYDVSEYWSETVIESLKERNLPFSGVMSVSKKDSSLEKTDLLFIDGYLEQPLEDKISARLEVAYHYTDSISNSIVMFDDAQWFKDELHTWSASLKYHTKTVWYNPTERLDRLIYMSIPESKMFCLELISECVSVSK